MNHDAISCFFEASRTVVGGVCAFIIGMAGGMVIITMLDYCYSIDDLLFCVVSWPAFIFYVMAYIWGLLYLPFIGIMFYGLIWEEWNRLACAGTITIVSVIVWMVCEQENPFSNLRDGIVFCVSMGTALGLVVLGVWSERRICIQQSSSSSKTRDNVHK